MDQTITGNTVFCPDGAAVSGRENELTQKGYKTAHKFSKDIDYTVRHIQGAIPIPSDFTKVVSVKYQTDNTTVEFTDINGLSVKAEIDLQFLL